MKKGVIWSKIRKKLFNMYINCLEEGKIPFNKRWINESSVNGITNQEYKGINGLILNYINI